MPSIKLDFIVNDKGTLVVKNFAKQVESATGKASAGFNRTTKAAGKTQKSVSSITSSLGPLKAALAGLGLGYIAKQFVDAASTSEKYRLRLNALLGSAQEGERVFKNTAEFASKVSFQFEELQGAAVTLSGVVRGGADEIQKMLPIIADLAAASGLSIEEATGQIVRMYSAGAGAADLFRERGINAMLGFQAGVTYSAEETMRQVIAAWEDAGSKFRGLSEGLANTFEGQVSMLEDIWFQFRNAVMDDSAFEQLKSSLSGLVAYFQSEVGKLDMANLAHQFASAWVTAAEIVGKAFNALFKIMQGIRGMWNFMEQAGIAIVGMTTSSPGTLAAAKSLMSQKENEIIAINDSMRALERIGASVNERMAASGANAGMPRSTAAAPLAAKTRGGKRISRYGAAGTFDASDVEIFYRDSALFQDAYINSLLETENQTDDSWDRIVDKTTESMDLIYEATRNMVEGIQSEMTHFFKDVLTGQMNGFLDYLTSFLDMLAGIMANIASMWLTVNLGGMLGFGPKAGDFALYGMSAWLMHEGGTVGQPGAMRNVNPAVFAGAPRLHSGLAADEFPAILQRGEEVIPRGETGGRNLRIINVLDPGLISKWASSADGERVIVNAISRNSHVLKRALA